MKFGALISRVGVVVLGLSLVSTSVAFAQTLAPALQAAIGKWQVINDEGKPAGQVELYLENGKLYGKVIARKPGTRGDEVCAKCPGDLKNRPILGMVFLRGFSPDGEVWSGGTLVDPDNGRTYRGKIKTIGANELQLRGYIGTPLLGRTQTWKRLP